MTIHTQQTTTHFVVKYDDSNSQAQGMAAAIAAICENEFTVLTGWFNITSGFGSADRITITVQQIAGGGADNHGYLSGGNTTIDVNFLPAGFSQTQANQIAPMMFVNEFVEVLMSFNDQQGTTTWNAGHSDGEGLSQFCGILRFPVGHYQAYGSFVNAWLSSPRPDWISSNESTDSNSVSFGCVLLFLFYLNIQLGFTPAQIIQNGAATPAGLYANLTGDASDPFGFFLSLIDSVVPGTATITGVTGAAQDNPFPIFGLQFWDNKNTFGLADVTDSVNHSRPFTDALLLVLEGTSPTQWQALGAPTPVTPALTAPGFPGISFTRSQVEFENAAIPLAPQRIHFHYDVTFDATSIPAFTTATQTKELDSSITIAGVTPPQAHTELEFFGAEDPYFSNINPTADNVPWLSNDLRVFASPATGTPVPGGPAFNTDTIAGARRYLQQLLVHLNASYGDSSLVDPFDPASNVIPEQTDALSGDSSVIPSLGFLGLGGTVYNFAIARVRLRGAVGTVSKPVSVYFRLWQTQTPDTDYQVGTTYNSHLDSLGLPAWPLPDPDNSTFPFFATSNTPDFTDANNTEFGVGGVNSQPITINSGQGQWQYFGCLLNVYDDTYLVNGTPVTQLTVGTHHCLVAQIAYDDAPIVVASGQTVTPGNTDKLAQRNLQISPAFNPGQPPTNRVPQTFDVRPSAPAPRSAPTDFDELMIDWGGTPLSSVASIYWPGANAQDVLRLANQRYGYHNLSVADPHTIQCSVVKGLTYVPIPPATGENLASLLTLDLPQTVASGQQFTIVVRRVATYIEPPKLIIQSPPLKSPAVSPRPARRQRPSSLATVTPSATSIWRYITGAFQVDIHVQTEATILPFDENTLAIFKWRLEVMDPTNRWYPILQRYIAYLSDRIDGLRGNSAAIVPSPNGLPEPLKLPAVPPGRDAEQTCGKVIQVLYDCFGDFQGFVLGCCEGDRAFESSERGIETLVLYALHQQAALEVIVSDRRHKITRLTLRREC